MSGFDLSELLPFYLDETDEHIAALNAALLRLEQDPTDSPALAEAFRMFHSIKGASVVMGFAPVNRLTHNLESLFDQFRVKKRMLDRPVLDLTFRCLDELRDYHRDLRAEGQSAVDLSGLTTQVIAPLETGAPPASPAVPTAAPSPDVSQPPDAITEEPALVEAPLLPRAASHHQHRPSASWPGSWLRELMLYLGVTAPGLRSGEPAPAANSVALTPTTTSYPAPADYVR